MIELLVRKFIKDSENVTDQKVRQRYGMFAGILGIICNLVLFAAKVMAGLLTASVAILADAFNNLSDAGSSIVTLLGFKMAGKPADPDHPFGHGRIEYLSGLFVAFAIMLMGIELFKTSVEKIFHPEPIIASVTSVVILIASIGVKLWMCYYNKKLGKKINSSAIAATATDSLSDCIATAVVLASVVISEFTGLKIDGIAGAVVAIFVFLAGIQTVRDTVQPLLGQPADPDFVRELEEIVLSHKEITGIHDMIIHDYGPRRVFATLHAEIPFSMNLLEAHDIIDLTEKEIQQKLKCSVSIHMDPIVYNDATVNALREMVTNILQELDERITMHDFRITQGPLIKNLIFDIVVPYNFGYSDEQIIEIITYKIKRINDSYYVVIQVDKSFQ